MSATSQTKTFALIIAFGVLLPGCGAFTPTSPERRACINQAWASKPDLNGTWEAPDGARFNIRHSLSNQAGLEITLAADSPTTPDWQPQTAGLKVPAMKSTQPPVCGETWTIALRKHFPNRTAQPGQFVNKTERVTGSLSGDSINFEGQVWKRVGAVAAIEVPKPGTEVLDRELTGTTLETITLEHTNQRSCAETCKTNDRCAAFVKINLQCTLLASVTGIKQTKGAISFVNPNYDFRGPPPLPLAGLTRRDIELVGTQLEVKNVGSRGAERKCQMACDANWSCQGYSVETWKGQCRMFSSVTAAKRSKNWRSKVQVKRVARRPYPGHYAQDNQLAGTTLEMLNTKTRGMRGCHEACTKNEKCKGFNFLKIKDANSVISSNNKCQLLSSIGAPRLVQNWTTYVELPRPPKVPLGPPPQDMSSPLCKGHPAARAYAMTTSVFDPKVRNHYVGFDKTKTLTYKQTYRREQKIFIRELAGGNVHFHAMYEPDLVLKRVDGEVAVGAADASSSWRIEHLWEHMDPPVSEGVWYVVRDTDTGMFLSSNNGALKLVGSPDDRRTHWRFTPLPPRNKAIRFPVQEPAPIPLDEQVVEKLTNWAVKEHGRQQQPACWKEGGSGQCPSGQDTNCGLFCAKSTAQCFLEVTEMVQSVSELALNIAGAVLTGGAANAGLRAAKVGGQAGKMALRMSMKTAGRQLSKKLQTTVGARVIRFVATRGKSEAFKKLAKAVAKDAAIKAGKLTAKQAMSAAAEEYLKKEEARRGEIVANAYAEEVARRAAEKIALAAAAGEDPDLLAIAAMVDPTGVSAVVDAFVKPICKETPMPDINF